MALSRGQIEHRREAGRGAGCRFRPMTEADLPAVMAIERACYEFPWTAGIFRDCIHAGYYCCLLVQDEAIAGYGVMAVAAGEAHVLNLCVRQSLQGQGLGRIQLEHLIDTARAAGGQRMLLEVRASNQTAITLYQRLGFVEIGLRRGYYPARHAREDAIVLTRVID
jgi:ribosomal-protein-alanine N-acetyltransferase